MCNIYDRIMDWLDIFFCYGLPASLHMLHSAPLQYVDILDILVLLICYASLISALVPLVHDGLLHACC